MSISEALVADFRQEAGNTRLILDAVPEAKLDWKPHEKSMSLGQLAGHLAETPAWTPSMLADELDVSSMPSDWKPFVPKNHESLLATFEQHARGFQDFLAGKDDAFLSGMWTMRHGEKVLMNLPKHAAIRQIAIHHVIHHRGQLTVYLRLLGVAIPPIYGPTADQPDMF